MKRIFLVCSLMSGLFCNVQASFSDIPSAVGKTAGALAITGLAASVAGCASVEPMRVFAKEPIVHGSDENFIKLTSLSVAATTTGVCTLFLGAASLVQAKNIPYTYGSYLLTHAFYDRAKLIYERERNPRVKEAAVQLGVGSTAYVLGTSLMLLSYIKAGGSVDSLKL